MDKRKSNILTFSFGKNLCKKNLPIFRRKLSIASYILIGIIAIGSYSIKTQAAELEQQEEVQEVIISPEVPFDTSELTSINYRLEEMQETMDKQLEETKQLNENVVFAIGLLTYILGSITLVIIVCTFRGVYRWLYSYLKFE